MKRILILRVDYGYGHRNAANAIMKAIHGQNCVVETVNPLNEVADLVWAAACSNGRG